MTTTLLDYLEAKERKQEFRIEAGTVIWGDGKLHPDTVSSFYDYWIHPCIRYCPSGDRTSVDSTR